MDNNIDFRHTNPALKMHCPQRTQLSDRPAMAEPEAEHGIHALLLPNPSQGHINPILQFGKRLVAAPSGVRCTLAATRLRRRRLGHPLAGRHLLRLPPLHPSDGGDEGLAGREAGALGRVRLFREPRQTRRCSDGRDGGGVVRQRQSLPVGCQASEISKVPENFADKSKEKGLIVTWSPQLEVLAHPAVGCFVTHCGWNSTTEGMGAGVPMVAMPQWSEQTMNAKYIEDVWRVGVRVRPDERGVVRKEEVERCVREVMEGERSMEYRQNATNWKKAKRAMSEGGSSNNSILEFIGKLGPKSK
ncbi:hypothetical protein PAHAL_1G120400 [Panicum hallii]|jgi:hypothetical protein|uniref:Uncharacterized protein n=1 Tax=Panicum hallii TaxID=206008 RepID=A0A2T8KUY6_9POAL|nr:hypothetical protein PAHAL_1G120400 [Panicum hallii]